MLICSGRIPAVANVVVTPDDDDDGAVLGHRFRC